jgi:hypothetical protein
VGRHSAWNEAEHPRAFDGKFDHISGSSGGGNAHKSSRGMPDTLASADIPGRDGKELALDAHPDGSVSVSSGVYSVKLSHSAFGDLRSFMKDLDGEDVDDGEEAWVKSDRLDANGHRNGSGLAALVRKEGDDVTVRLAPHDNASVDDLRNAPEVRLNSKGIDKLDDESFRMSSASRIDTGNGDMDIAVTSDKKVSITHIGEDGKPKTTQFDAKSYAKVAHAIDAVVDGWDDNDPTLDENEVVRKRSFSTNAGKVNVELIGTSEGNGPEDRLRIMAEDESWGVVIDGPQQKAFHDAIGKINDALEAQDIDIYPMIGDANAHR